MRLLYEGNRYIFSFKSLYKFIILWVMRESWLTLFIPSWEGITFSGICKNYVDYLTYTWIALCKTLLQTNLVHMLSDKGIICCTPKVKGCTMYENGFLLFGTPYGSIFKAWLVLLSTPSTKSFSVPDLHLEQEAVYTFTQKIISIYCLVLLKLTKKLGKC
jgi:hypothetical protein